MKILYVISGDLWGGAEEQAFSLIKEITDTTEHSVEIITFNHGLLTERLQHIGISANVIDEKKCNSFVLFWKIFLFLKGRQVDVLHTHGPKEHFLGGLAGRLTSVKRIVRTFHGRGLLSSGVKKNIDRFSVLFLADRVVAVSAELASYLISCGFDEHKINVIKNGVNIQALKKKIQRRSQKIQKHPGGNSFVFGVVGRLVPVKGHKYLFSAFKQLLEKGCNVTLLVLGNGPLEKEFRTVVRDMDIAEHVFLLGFVENPLDYVVDFDVFVMPSLNEGIPLALLEAMGLGVPVIASGVGGIPEVIDDGRTGLLVEPKSVDELYSSCLRLYEDPDLQKELAGRARAHIKNEFSARKTMQETLHLYADS